jgi:hypothetical protein
MGIFGNEDASFTRVIGTSAGSTQVKTGFGHLFGVYAGITSAGTNYYYDSPTLTGTSATNQIAAVASNGTKIPDFFPFQVVFKQGLVVQTSAGSADQTVFWN